MSIASAENCCPPFRDTATWEFGFGFWILGFGLEFRGFGVWGFGVRSSDSGLRVYEQGLELTQIERVPGLTLTSGPN